jgi:hypothetical protein
MFRQIMLLPPHIEAYFVTEAGVTDDVTDDELIDFAARSAIKRYQGVDLGERPQLLVLLPHGLRSITSVDRQLDAAFEEMRQMRELLGENVAD